jgi:hypothetical protein
MFDLNSSVFEWCLFITAIISIVLPIAANRWSLPVFMVLGRWLRWVLFGALFAFFLEAFELSSRPDWVHFVTGIAVWFLLETGYNWIAIKALSRSEIPLFPNFKKNEDGDEWPADTKFIELRDWLRKEKFKRLTAVKAELFAEMHLRALVYESEDQFTRIQLLFIPKRKGGALACYSLTSQLSEDKRLITDNMFLPYGGYYPESWNLMRKPLVGSLKRLLLLHRKRLLNSQFSPTAFEGSAEEDINDQQRILERLNIELGFLVKRGLQEEEGKITYEGRYRLWKEMWLLAYLGRSV